MMTQKLLQLATLTMTREAAAHAHEQNLLCDNCSKSKRQASEGKCYLMRSKSKEKAACVEAKDCATRNRPQVGAGWGAWGWATTWAQASPGERVTLTTSIAII
jgi:hypothetical protein